MSNKITAAIIIFYLVGNYLLLNVVYKNDGVMITTYDVGQGDAILLEIKDIKILIDGGPNFEIDRLLNSKFFAKECYLDLILLTHPHKDHVKGINRVLEHCKVGMIIYNSLDFDTREYDYFKKLAENFEIRHVKKGDFISIYDVDLYVLWPEYNEKDLKVKNVNNESIVLLLDYYNFEALFMGDLENEASLRLDLDEMHKYIQEGLDLYKVPHQGSRDSLNLKILTTFRPKICVLSVGNYNNFGHPHPIVLEKLSLYGCEVYRTDVQGSIEVLAE